MSCNGFEIHWNDHQNNCMFKNFSFTVPVCSVTLSNVLLFKTKHSISYMSLVKQRWFPSLFPPLLLYKGWWTKAALFSLKDEHSVMTKKLQKTPGWFTCKPFQTDAYFSHLCNITDSAVITTQKLSGYSYPANFGHIYAHKENKCPQENKTPMTNSDS